MCLGGLGGACCEIHSRRGPRNQNLRRGSGCETVALWFVFWKDNLKKKLLTFTKNYMGRLSGLRSWGPAGWTFLHVMSWTYPEEPSAQDREDMFIFLHAFAKVLPCTRCRRHWSKLLSKALPSSSSPRLSSRTSLAGFLVDAHNDVNGELGKPVVTHDEARRLFDPRTPACFPHRAGVFIAVVALVLLFLLFRSCPTLARVRSRYRTFLHPVGSAR